MNNTFSLIALDLTDQPEGHILKTLKQQIYIFDRRYVNDNGHIVYRSTDDVDVIVDDLYGENIRIQAIVGKNGAGKTSVLDVIYRIINNLSFSLAVSTSSWTSLYFIEELKASLYYAVSGKAYCIHCDGRMVTWSEVDTITCTEVETIFSSDWGKERFNEDELVKRSKELFYVIVTNYSPQALVSDDYRGEKVSDYNRGKYYDREYSSWMPCLFHKNDGYKTPICIAPFREENGAINMSKEFRLTTYRLSSIFLYYFYKGDNANTVIDSYSLSDIRYEFNPAHAYTKFKKYNGDSKKRLNSSHGGTYGKRILSILNLLDVQLMNKCEVYRAGCEYLVAKVVSIVDTYQNYSKYRRLFFKRDTVTRTNILRTGVTSPMPDPKMPELLEKLMDKLLKDKSHITIKFRQALYMLKYIKSCDEQGMDYTWLSDESKSISFRDYLLNVFNLNTITTIEELQECLPPPVFDIKIELLKSGDKEKTPILLADLSSGEKQLLYVMSTIVYHTMNLKSVANESDRVSYKNIFLMLDEVEICFHPDYQRQFISRLISMIRDMKINMEYSFYILIATHSPFMLSDIPQRNILYLEDGADAGHKITINPFCANVNDILDQSFFMDHGFSGEFATGKVKEIIDQLESSSPVEEGQWKYIDTFIDKIIGDPILRDALGDMCFRKRNSL